VRRLRVKAVAIALVAGALLLGAAGSARADGDPASDTLLYANAYLPYAAPSKAASADLAKQIDAVYRAGNRVKVAVIQARTDLGAIPSLFGKPTAYAQFLGEEISGVYIGPLLIVMHKGYGIYDGGRTVAAEQRVLAGLPTPGTSSDDLVDAAAAAVAKLQQAGALRSRDVLKPYAQPLVTRLQAHVLTVVFYLYDDSGKASAAITAVRGGKVLLTFRLPTRTTSVLRPVSQKIPVPASLSLARASVCVAAVDPSGNRAKACKRL
jgi:hypothetical protein